MPTPLTGRQDGRGVAALVGERPEVGAGAVGPSMRSLLILQAVWQAVESPQQTACVGLRGREKKSGQPEVARL
jgi:hypothetical protein